MLANEKPMGFVPTRDLKAARAFYEGTLGLECVDEDGFALTVRAGGIRVRLVKIENHRPAAFTIFGWEVGDIEKAVSEVAARGVAFEKYGMPGQDERGIWKSPNGARVAWFKDADGNVLSLTQLG